MEEEQDSHYPAPLSDAEHLDFMQRASRAMGHDLLHSTVWFIDLAMHWLASRLGDLHVEYHEVCGWSVACCHEEQSWEGWQHDARLSGALAKAVLAIEDHPK